MKVVCETCEAKYQIPDERLAGRRLKIRCRKCGGIMEARGDELSAQPSAPGGPTGGATGATEWFVSVDGTPIGPLTTDEMVSRISAGALEWDAHVWREGYAEWKTVDAADTIVRAVASSRGTIGDEPRPDSTERTVLPQNEASEGDPFEQDARTMNVEAPTIAALEDAPTRIAFDATPTRMYSGHSAPPGALQPVARSSFASRPPGHMAPVARPVISESSPNIELSRAQLPLPISSTRSPASVAPVRAGYAGAEGSGLIDIRALASLAQTRMNAPQQPRGIAPAAPSNGNGHDASDRSGEDVIENDPLASFGSGHGVAFAALDSLAPAANRERPKDKTIPLAILVGAAMIAAASFAAVYITRAPALAPLVVATAQPTAPVAMPEQIALAAAEPAAVARPVASEVDPGARDSEAAPAAQAVEPAGEAKDEQAPVVAAKSAKSGPRGGKRGGAHAARDEAKPAADPLEAELDETAAAKADEKAPPPSVDDILLADTKPADKSPEEKAAKPAPAADRSINDLLDGAVAAKKNAAVPAVESGVAEAPSRADVLASMKKIETEVRACAASEAAPVTGTANVAITVAGSSGKVTSAEVSGLTGAVGSCIARVARTATFAPFTREKFSVTFPYRFK